MTTDERNLDAAHVLSRVAHIVGTVIGEDCDCPPARDRTCQLCHVRRCLGQEFGADFPIEVKP